MHRPQWYRSPIDLPERVIGKARISHRTLKPGDTVPIVGMRQALMRGMRPVNGVVDQATRVHELSHDDHGVWMTDMPEELNQIGELLDTFSPTGDVLVGGLGLGILAATLASRPDVDSVTVVEIDRDVIALCSRPGYEVINRDIAKYLGSTCVRHDSYLLDTWQGTNEGTWWSRVMPLRRIIRQRWGKEPTIHCWAEDIMREQIHRSLTTKSPHWYYEGLPMPMSLRDATRFMRDVGSVTWEQKYGDIVDRSVAKYGLSPGIVPTPKRARDRQSAGA